MKLAASFKAGRLVFDPVELSICAREYGDKPLVVDVEPVRARRSTKQNARHWTVVLPLVRHYLDEHRKKEKLEPIDWDPKTWKEDLHEMLVPRHAGVYDTPLGPLRKRTRTMTVRQFYDFTESIVRWLATLGYDIEDPGPPPPDQSEDITEATA